MEGDPKKAADDSPEIETGEAVLDEAELSLFVKDGVKTALKYADDSTLDNSAIQKMDLLDAKPTLEFVEKNNEAFTKGILRLASRGGLNTSRRFVQETDFENFETTNCQMPLIRLKQILFSLPPELLSLSCLKKVIWDDTTPVPTFDENGETKPGADWRAEEDFIDGKIHPSRIYVGFTDFFLDEKNEGASLIKLTRIPKTVSEKPEAVFNYQVYTLLHEFMHTVLNLAVHRQITDKIILDSNAKNRKLNLKNKMIFGHAKTLKQWLEEFRSTILDGTEPILTSDYAESVEKQLHDTDPAIHMRALVEVVCETFAAYMIDIMPNKHGYTKFSEASFGNREFERESKSQSGCRTERFRLIKELCESAIIRSKK